MSEKRIDDMKEVQGFINCNFASWGPGSKLMFWTWKAGEYKHQTWLDRGGVLTFSYDALSPEVT